MGLTVPLFCLAVIFSMVQITRELKALNQHYQTNSILVFETIHKSLDISIKNWGAILPDRLKTLTEKILEKNPEIQMHIFDLLDRRLLYDETTTWTDFDHKATEASLYQKQLGKPYFVKVNKESQKLTAFIPIDSPDGTPVMVARVLFPLGSIREALINSRGLLIIIIVVIALTGTIIGLRLSRSIIRPLLILIEATREIVKGNLGRHVHIDTGDEIETLADTFNQMSDALKAMKQKAQDANPLTGLPGNQGIFQELKQRILERRKFVLYHTDLDRFKVFNDHFGLAKGDEAIKKTAKLLRDAMEKAGTKDDFIGHQGGDDFVVITSAARAIHVAEYIIKQFDSQVVRELYSKDDVERGYTMQIDRRRLAETGEEQLAKFPLLAISLAGVSNAKKDFADYFDCMSAAVSVKKEVKKDIHSSYLIKE